MSFPFSNKKDKLKSQILFILISEQSRDNHVLQLKNIISLRVFAYTFWLSWSKLKRNACRSFEYFVAQPWYHICFEGGIFCNAMQELGTLLSYPWQKQLYAPWQLRSPIMYPAMPYQPWEPLIHQIYSSYLCAHQNLLFYLLVCQISDIKLIGGQAYRQIMHLRQHAWFRVKGQWIYNANTKKIITVSDTMTGWWFWHYFEIGKPLASFQVIPHK